MTCCDSRKSHAEALRLNPCEKSLRITTYINESQGLHHAHQDQRQRI